MASLDARRTPLPTLWKPTPIFLCPFVANNEVLRILIKISFPRRHPYFSLFLFIQVPEQDYTSSAGFLRAYYQKIPEIGKKVCVRYLHDDRKQGGMMTARVITTIYGDASHPVILSAAKDLCAPNVRLP